MSGAQHQGLRRTALLFGGLLTLIHSALPSNVHAQPPEPLRSLLTDDVMAIARIDLQQLHDESIASLQTPLSPMLNESTWKDVSTQWQNTLELAKETVGAAEVVVAVIPNDLPQTFGFIAIRTSHQGANEKGHAQLANIAAERQWKADRKGDWTILWDDRTKSRLRKFPAVTRGRTIDAAWESLMQQPISIAYISSADSRRVFSELTPPDAPLVGSALGKNLAAIDWACLRFDTRSAELAMDVNTLNNDAAQQLLQMVEKAKAELGTNDNVRKLLQSPQDIAAALNVTAVDSRVTAKLPAAGLNAIAANLAPHVAQVRNTNRRNIDVNRFKQIGLACHNYFSDRHKVLPADSYSDDGKPLLSWRVHILPYLEQNELYKQFHLDEPWDSPHNSKLLSRMPEVYRLPSRSDVAANHTVVQRPAGDGFMGQRKPVAFRDIIDGTSNTVMTIEAAAGVPWTKPADWEFASENFQKSVGGPEAESFIVGRGDGSVSRFPRTAPADVFRKFLTMAGQELVTDEMLRTD